MAGKADDAMGARRSGAWAGWIGFAGTMLLLIGAINVFEGLLAVLAGERVVAAADEFVLVDMTSWGWTLVVSGGLLSALGIGLLMWVSWARIAAIVVLGLHAASQVVWLGAYPIWSLLMIALDTVVIFALTMRWSAARPDDDGGARAPGAAADPLGGQLPHRTVSYGPRLT
jgi:hypothetical protein